MEKFIKQIDWALLRDQKRVLLSIPEQLVSPLQYDSLQGVISLLDGLQDFVVDKGYLSSKEVFDLPKDPE
jgi:hypothetical protein